MGKPVAGRRDGSQRQCLSRGHKSILDFGA